MKNTLTAIAGSATRLDKALVAAFPAYSRARLQALIEEGAVKVDGKVNTTASTKLKGGEEITLCVPQAIETALMAETIPLDVVYEDKHLLVINKPAGMVVHPSAGHGKGTLVNALLAYCKGSLSGIGGVARPGIVHRLDKDTSGLMVVAKTDAAHKGLSAQFSDHSLSRTYNAITWGHPPTTKGVIDAAIGRSASRTAVARKKMAVVKAGRTGGRHARTHFTVDEKFGPFAALLSCVLETGRTHQIRVHLAHLGCSVLGDPSYGAAKGHRQKTEAALKKLAQQDKNEAAIIILGFPRQALHAAELSFVHPITGKKMAFTADWPTDMKALLKALKKLSKI